MWIESVQITSHSCAKDFYAEIFTNITFKTHAGSDMPANLFFPINDLHIIYDDLKNKETIYTT